MIPSWVGAWIGKPFAPNGRGPDVFDCYGLLRAIVFARRGVELPSLVEGYDGIDDAKLLAELIDRNRSDWAPVQIESARECDAVLLRVVGLPIHVGVVVAPPLFVHAREGADTVVERWDGPIWRRRLLGIYRHRSLA